MKKVFVAFIFVLGLTSIVFAEPKDIHIEGISNDIVIINGRVLREGGRIDGMTVLSIKDKVVTFKDEGGQTFTKTLNISAEDKTKSFGQGFFSGNKTPTKKKEKKKDKVKASQRGSAKSSSFLDGLMDNLFSDKGRKVKKVKRSSKNMSLSEKRNLAEKDQREFKKDTDALLMRLRQSDLSEKDINKEMKYLEALVKENIQRFNDLKLPCPASAEAQRNSSYRSWQKKFQEQQDETLNKVNAKIQEAAMKVYQR